MLYLIFGVFIDLEHVRWQLVGLQAFAMGGSAKSSAIIDTSVLSFSALSLWLELQPLRVEQMASGWTSRAFCLHYVNYYFSDTFMNKKHSTYQNEIF